MTVGDEHIALGDPIPTRQQRHYELAKRILDVIFAMVILILFAPLWIVVAIAIRLTSPGPAIYCLRHEVGREGRKFTMYKFRTMFSDNDEGLHKRAVAELVRGQPLSFVESKGVQVPIYKIVNDPRMTPLGRFLRKYGLDEIPQFINVLRGDMSVVGPRPAMYYEYELYGEYHRKRFSVQPGITGLYQVTARSEVPFDRMVELDLEYIARRSFWLDIWIILKTPWVMFTGKGAH